MYFELQDAAHTPLGGARYTVVGYTFCTDACCLRGLPDGARLDLGSAPLSARRDAVAIVAVMIGNAAAVVDTA